MIRINRGWTVRVVGGGGNSYDIYIFNVIIEFDANILNEIDFKNGGATGDLLQVLRNTHANFCEDTSSDM